MFGFLPYLQNLSLQFVTFVSRCFRCSRFKEHRRRSQEVSDHTAPSSAPSPLSRLLSSYRYTITDTYSKMKSAAALVLAFVASASAYAPLMATRAVGKKTAPAAASSAPPESKGYPSFREAAENVKFGNISGGGNKAPPQYFKVPDFSNPAKQIERDPAFYAEAAKTRKSKAFRGVTGEYVYDDGLTDLERQQRQTIPMFLTGGAKSQKDVSTIRDDIVADDLIFGLDPDRFQLLFIAVFGLFTLVGCLSGNLNL